MCVSGKEEVIQRVNQMIKYKYLSQESKKVRRKEKMGNMEEYNNTRIVKRQSRKEKKKERQTNRRKKYKTKR